MERAPRVPRPAKATPGRRSADEDEPNKLFQPAGYETHLVETLEKDLLQKHPDVQWNRVAGLRDAKAILQVKATFITPFSLGPLPLFNLSAAISKVYRWST